MDKGNFFVQNQKHEILRTIRNKTKYIFARNFQLKSNNAMEEYNTSLSLLHHPIPEKNLGVIKKNWNDFPEKIGYVLINTNWNFMIPGMTFD